MKNNPVPTPAAPCPDWILPNRAVLAFFAGLAILILAAPGCLYEYKPVKTYEEAVAERGEPYNCERKPDGTRYCSWLMEGEPGGTTQQLLVMVFDEQGRFVRSYPLTEFRPTRVKPEPGAGPGPATGPPGPENGP